MRTLAVVLAFCAALGAQPADDLDQLFQRAPVVRAPIRGHRSFALLDARGGGDRVQRSGNRRAPPARRHQVGAGSNAADEAYGMLLQIYLRSGQYRRWLTSYRAVGCGHSRFRACSRRRRRREQTRRAARSGQRPSAARRASARPRGFDDSRISRRESRRLSLRHRRLGIGHDRTKGGAAGIEDRCHAPRDHRDRPANPPASVWRSRKRSRSAAPVSATCRSRSSRGQGRLPTSTPASSACRFCSRSARFDGRPTARWKSVRPHRVCGPMRTSSSIGIDCCCGRECSAATC